MPGPSGFTAGWLDSSIHDFLGELRGTSPGLRYALVTTLDSSTSLDDLIRTSPTLRPLAPQAKALGRGLILPTERLIGPRRGPRIFFGFDEVYFFARSPEVPKPATFTIVGPGRIDAETLSEAAPWLQRTACSLALGDGTGLNFVVKASGLARALLAHSAGVPLLAD